MSYKIIDLDTVEASTACTYPEQFRAAFAGRVKRRLASAAGLTQLSVLTVDLPPGVAGSLSFWQSDEDEFVYVLEGTPTLVTDEGDIEMRPGQSVGFPAGARVGRHFENRSDAPVRLIEIAALAPGGSVQTYTRDDLKLVPASGGGKQFVRRDGSSY